MAWHGCHKACKEDPVSWCQVRLAGACRRFSPWWCRNFLLATFGRWNLEVVVAPLGIIAWEKDSKKSKRPGF